ncbi:MAG: RlmF-related methyltransferase, partial [Bacteroidales bacterium]|nr:RlmF-related methyltransferase [Bacteroidales bacterium]
MDIEKRVSTKENLHTNNKHRKAYNFKKLIQAYPDLEDFVRRNEYGDFSVNYSDNKAVLALNKAILISDYGIINWDIPKAYLCPPIPGRAEYIHHIHDLIKENIADKKEVSCLDIGVGANCIYPIVGAVDYSWKFVGSDINKAAIDCAQETINSNKILKSNIELRFQPNSNFFFKGIIKEGEYYDVSICNPPFFTSQKDYEEENLRKTQNLTGDNNAVL